MTDTLTAALTAALHDIKGSDLPLSSPDCDCSEDAAALTAHPAMAAVAHVVEAAEAFEDAWYDDQPRIGSTRLVLLAAVDALREVQRGGNR